MIAFKPNTPKPAQEGAPRPVASAEQWLGRNDNAKRRLWERLNPRHRKQLRVLARVLALRQTEGRLPPKVRERLNSLLNSLQSIVTSLEYVINDTRQSNSRSISSISANRKIAPAPSQWRKT